MFTITVYRRENDDCRSPEVNNQDWNDAKMDEYNPAIASLLNKIPVSQSALEKAWLFHEIGRAYFEMQNYKEAKDYGQKSLVAAQEADDKSWGLNALILLSQAKGRL